MIQTGCTPAEFGRLTVWQIRNLYGFAGDPPKFTHEEAYWNRQRILGLSEFETWKGWRQLQEAIKP